MILFSASSTRIFLYVTIALIAVTMTVLIATVVKVLRQTLKEKRRIDEAIRNNPEKTLSEDKNSSPTHSDNDN